MRCRYSKTLAEKRAWELCKQQSRCEELLLAPAYSSRRLQCGSVRRAWRARALRTDNAKAITPAYGRQDERGSWCIAEPRWDLVTVLPAAVYGPPISARVDGESAKRIKVCRLSIDSNRRHTLRSKSDSSDHRLIPVVRSTVAGAGPVTIA